MRDPRGGASSQHPAAVPELCAVVLGSRGGSRLARVLASVAWAGERIVLDPANRLAAAELPAGVRRERAARPAEVTDSAWLLLLDEDEAVPQALAAQVAAVVRAETSCSAYRIAQEVHTLGACLRPRRDPIRLARRNGARLVLGRGLAATLSVTGSVGRLAAALEKHGAESLGEAVDDLDAHAGMIAALLDDTGARPGISSLMIAFVAAGGHVLAASGPAPRPWSRWSLAFLAGYRAMVAYAKLWEVRWMHGIAAP